MTFFLGMIVGGFLVAAYFYDREQDKQAPRDKYDDAPDSMSSNKTIDNEKK